MQELWYNFKRCNLYLIGILRDANERTEEIFEVIVAKNYNIKLQNTTEQQTTDPRITKNTKQDKK